MPEVENDEVREERIVMEIIVDAYGPEEQAMGWYCYLDDKLSFPFKARCIVARRISPLKVGEEVEVVGMAPEDECRHEMFVEINWSGRSLAVPLAQIEPLEPDDETDEAVEDWPYDETCEAIEDWHYWVARGYELG
jgi:hypothetical protein